MDEILFLGRGSFVSKNGNTLYKVAFGCLMNDKVGDSFDGYESSTTLCSKEIYDAFDSVAPLQTVNGIVIRENYQLKIARILD